MISHSSTKTLETIIKVSAITSIINCHYTTVLYICIDCHITLLYFYCINSGYRSNFYYSNMVSGIQSAGAALPALITACSVE